MKDLPSSTPPVYCTQDRMVLMETTVKINQRYDAISGTDLTEVLPERRCQTKGHDVWRLYDKKWIKVQ